ncbi:hypothetical protein OSB04_001238 [Centaurea solstitialis]|uniref:Uncharacterized protein n=1 Tax=Centaurea solstitialis TaxID=347529 RepID=A0AA38U8V8_9ASTR|nr:hypothetical protein OSB04_001238 [Centaurea solstitialis]
MMTGEDDRLPAKQPTKERDHPKAKNTIHKSSILTTNTRMRTIKVLYGSGFDTMNACHIIVHIHCCTPSTNDNYIIGYAHQFTYIYIGDAILHATLYMYQLRPTSAPKWVIKNDEVSMLVMDFQQLSAI